MEKDMSWKVLNSKYLYKENWFTVRSERCKTPEGKIVDPYYVFEFPDWVNAVAFTKEGEMLLIRQYRHALRETIIEIPGGCIDDTDANPEAAMRRELLEETGYAFESVDALGEISTNTPTNTNITYICLAKEGEKVQQQDLDPNEETEVKRYESEQVISLLKENKTRQSLHTTCLFYGFLKLGLL